jgi:hypothetical protein
MQTQTYSQPSLRILFVLLMCAGTAFAQVNNDGGAEMSQKEAESYAKMIFGADIRAGKLTEQKAGALFVCGNERYAQKLNPELAERLFSATQDLSAHQDKGILLSDEKKAQYGRAYKDASRFQREAEDSCRKELKIDPSVKRLFQGFGNKREQAN